MTNDITHHLEQHLGTITEGWSHGSGIQVVRFADTPETGVDTYSTLGLSETVLPMSGGRTVRQEFLVSVYASYEPPDVASFLLTFAEYVISKERALLRGDVVGPSTPLIEGVEANAVYASMPVFFDDSFFTFSATEPSTVMVWLIPLPSVDAKFVHQQGWEAFEDRLEAGGVDFWDMNRAGVA